MADQVGKRQLDPNVFPFDAFTVDMSILELLLDPNWKFKTSTLIALYRMAVPAWNAAVTYNVNDLVISNGALWVCKATSTNNVPPNATYWYGMRTYGA